MHRALNAAAAALALAACGAVPRAHAPPPRAPRPAVGPPPERWIDYAGSRVWRSIPPWHFVGGTRVDAPSECGEPARERWVRGGSRFEVEGDESRAAEETLRAPIVAAVPTADGWRWFTAREVWASATWLGPLHRVAAWPDASPVPAPGRPVAVREGVLFGVPSPPRRWVITAGFVDDRHGFALTEPGVILETTDAGGTWRRLPSPGPLVTELTVRLRSVHASVGAYGARWILRANRWEPLPLPMGAPAVSDRELLHWRVWWALAVPLAWDHGRIALFDASRFGVYDVATDRVAAAEAPGCSVDHAFFAERLFAACRREGDDELLSFDGSWRRRMRFRSTGYGVCVASADGLDLACLGPCATDADRGARGVCVVHGEAPPVTLHGIDEGGFVPVGFRDGALVSVARGDALDALRVRVGDEAPRALGDAWPAGSWTLEALAPRLDRNGRLHLLARGADDTLAVLDGWPGGAWTRRDGPRLRDASLCGDEGVVVGIDRGGVEWASADARGQWRRLAAASAWGRWSARVQCTAASWQLRTLPESGGGVSGGDIPVAWEGRGWGPTRTDDGTLLGDDAPSLDDDLDAARARWWRCAVDGTSASTTPLRDDASLTARAGPRSITSELLRATWPPRNGETDDPVGEGPFALDGDVGRLHARRDGELVAVSARGEARPLGRASPRACEGGARGDLALRVLVTIDPLTEPVRGALHLAIDRRGLCVPSTPRPGPDRDGDGPVTVTSVAPTGDAYLAQWRTEELRVGLRCTAP
ncbi:MAG: hypothetical protein U0324_21910 [Polyangiales bacterium]